MGFHSVPQPELRDECNDLLNTTENEVIRCDNSITISKEVCLEQLPGREEEIVIFREETDDDWDDMQDTKYWQIQSFLSTSLTFSLY